MGITDNLVSHWKLEETDGTAARVDSHGSNNCEVTHGSFTSIAGKVGVANSFAGSTANRMRIDSPPTSLAGGTNARILAALWVKPTNFASLSTVVGSWIAGGAANSWRLDILATSGLLRMWIRNLADSANQNLDSTVALTAGEWNFIAGWYDGVNQGVRVGSIEKTTPYADGIAEVSGGSADFAIGAYGPNGLNPFLGDIDEVSVFKKITSEEDRILSESELTHLMNTAYPWPTGGVSSRRNSIGRIRRAV